MLPGPYSRSTNFRRWTNLTSILIVISFRLEQQAWFRVCVVPLVPITFHFIITLTWCRRRSITSSWTLATKVSRSSTFWAHPGYQLDSWWEIPSLPRWIVLSSTTLLPSHQHKLVHVWCYTLSSLLSSNCSSLPWSITILYVKNVLRFVPPLENSWHRNTSHHHHSFLVPVLIPTSERCCLDSFLLATLLFFEVNGRKFILRLLIIESPFWHWSCNPTHISGAPFNQCLIVYVFLEHTSLYHLIWQMLSPCSLNGGNPSFGEYRRIAVGFTRHLLVLSLG